MELFGCPPQPQDQLSPHIHEKEKKIKETTHKIPPATIQTLCSMIMFLAEPNLNMPIGPNDYFELCLVKTS